MIAWITANWVPLTIGAGLFFVGYLDGCRDTNSKWHKKMAESVNSGTALKM